MSYLSEKYYDASTESRVIGVISGPVTAGRGPKGAATIPITSEGEVLEVIIAPDWFVQKQSISFEERESIEVLGSFIRHAGRLCLLAREICLPNKRYFFRDPYGQPLWRVYANNV